MSGLESSTVRLLVTEAASLVTVTGSTLPLASAGFCFVCNFERGLSAIDGVAEKTIKPVRSKEAIIALLLIIAFIRRGSCPM